MARTSNPNRIPKKNFIYMADLVATMSDDRDGDNISPQHYVADALVLGMPMSKPPSGSLSGRTAGAYCLGATSTLLPGTSPSRRLSITGRRPPGGGSRIDNLSITSQNGPC
jgi:hypothetical protein